MTLSAAATCGQGSPVGIARSPPCAAASLKNNLDTMSLTADSPTIANRCMDGVNASRFEGCVNTCAGSTGFLKTCPNFFCNSASWPSSTMSKGWLES